MEVLGHPDAAVGFAGAEDGAIDEDHAAVVILHRLFFDGVEFFDLHLAGFLRFVSGTRSEFQEGVARAVIAGVVEEIAVWDGGGDDSGGVTGRIVAEEEFARLGIEGDDPRFAGGYVEGGFADRLFHDRDVLGLFGVSFGSEGLFAGGFVKADEERFAAGGSDDAVAVDEDRFSEAPFGDGRFVLVDEVDAPNRFAFIGFEASEDADVAEGVDEFAIEGRGAAWAAAPTEGIIFGGAGAADFGLPALFPFGGIDADHVAAVFAGPEGVEEAIADREGRIADAGFAEFPLHFGATFGPALEQLLWRGVAIAIRAAPLGPIAITGQCWGEGGECDGEDKGFEGPAELHDVAGAGRGIWEGTDGSVLADARPY